MSQGEKKMANNKVVSEIIEDVKAEICDNYCKYPEQWVDKEGEMMDEICKNCPLGKL